MRASAIAAVLTALAVSACSSAGSRWSTERSGEWQPLKPKLVVEVAYDHVTGDRFRHGTRLLRWRPDKAPAQCRMDQLQPEIAPADLEAMLVDPN